jgi:hypothetical protein
MFSGKSVPVGALPPPHPLYKAVNVGVGVLGSLLKIQPHNECLLWLHTTFLYPINNLVFEEW